MRSTWLLLGLGLYGLGCGAPAKSPTSEPASSETERTEAPREQLELGEAVVFDDEVRVVERLRGLETKRPVVGRSLDGDELEILLERAFKEQVPPHVSAGNEAFLKLFQLVPEDFRYRETLISLLRLGIAGLYEPRDQKLYLRRELSPKTRRSTLLHELVHALEDQHFDLSPFTRFEEDASDHQSAHSCLAEGDAMSVMTDALLAGSGKTALDLSTRELFLLHAEENDVEDEKSAEFLRTSPPPSFLLRSLLAPYVDGVEFVRELRQSGGFDAVNRAFSNPPATTEQVLHHEKFRTREVPVVVPLPASPGDGWTLFFHDILGEQTLRLVLEEWETPAGAGAAAAGWGGDRVGVFRRGSEVTAAWVVETDTAEDAEELERAWADRLAQKGMVERLEKGGSPERNCVERGALGPLAYARRGRRVVAIAGPYDEKALVRNGTNPPEDVVPQVVHTCADVAGWLTTLAGH